MERTLSTLAISALPVFLTLTLSVALQAWLANRMGDLTPYRQGRLSWDPIKHMDWIGTVIAPAMSILIVGGTIGVPVFFGWAKNLELNMQCYRTKSRQFLIESPIFLGPLLMGLIWMIMNKLLVDSNSFMQQVSAMGIRIGIGFFAIALLPFPPFPLGNLLLKYLPSKYLIKIQPYLQYSFLILLLLLFTGLLQPYLALMAGIANLLLELLTIWL
jgi:Zn-dependent protease